MFNLIIGSIQSFFGALGMILTKKVVENKKVGNNWQTFITKFNHFIVLIILFGISAYIFYFDAFDLKISKDVFTFFNISIFIVSTLGLYITYPLRRNAYANEKVSVLQPFAMLSQVFPVIFAFIFIASERANLITFLISIFASLVVIASSIDYKKIKINKYSLMVLSSSIIKSIQIFVVIYFIKLLSPSNYYLIETIFILFFSFFLILVKNEFNEIKLITQKYAKLLFITNLIVIVSILISLTMYLNLGIVLTSLLNLLYLVFVYLLGYLVLKEKPSKKDIIITFFVAVCIIIGLYFKS